MTGRTIRQKLAMTIAISLGIGLLLSFLIFSVREVDQRRAAKIAELTAMAEVVAFNASAVVDFQDKAGAERLFISLAAHPDVIAADLLSLPGGLSHEFHKPGETLPKAHDSLGKLAVGERHQISDPMAVVVSVPILSGSDVVGAVILTASLSRVWQSIAVNLSVYFLGSVVAFLAALSIARRMHAPLLDALHGLTGTAEVVAESKDYSRRATKTTDDEIGQLVDAFNGMLNEIAERDSELSRYRDHLEETVLQRTQALSIAKDEAEAANRAKSTFLANMSHELRTPMSAIIGLTQMLSRKNTDPVQGEKLAKIDNAANHLLRLLNDILDLSKVDADKLSLERAVFRIDAMVGNLHSLIQGRAEASRLELLQDMDERLVGVSVLGDQLRLQQILLNLMTNAVKFTERGSVTLAIRIVEESDTDLRLQFAVRDTGIGIAPEAIGRVFNPFEQADGSTTRKFGGTGLGLSICHRLVALMGGDIRVESTPNVGSTFSFVISLPIAAKGAEARVETPIADSLELEETLIREFSGARILLAEDNLVSQEVAMELIGEVLGFSVDLAGDGLRAVELSQANTYDLILMDMQMPAMDGIEAAQRIRRNKSHDGVPIIALTANAFAEDRAACLAAGMNDFVAKPVNSGDLYRAMLHWLRAGRIA